MKKKKNYKKIINISILIISIIFLLYSLFNIFIWKKDSNKTNSQIKEIVKIVEIKELEITNNEEIIEQKEEIPESNPYWDYIKMNLIDVNFEELKKINPDTKGWIKVNGTNINYPYVQTSDNKFYLTHTFDKSYNKAGWVFQDYRNNETSRNTILYAHGRVDTTMFGSLKNILKSNWVKNKDNFIVKTSNEKENSLWQVFSVYKIPTTSDYLQVEFYSNDEFYNWANMLLKRSNYNFNTTINETDNIITLSTCSNDEQRIVLHAKLIKKEKKGN